MRPSFAVTRASRASISCVFRNKKKHGHQLTLGTVSILSAANYLDESQPGREENRDMDKGN